MPRRVSERSRATVVSLTERSETEDIPPYQLSEAQAQRVIPPRRRGIENRRPSGGFREIQPPLNFYQTNAGVSERSRLSVCAQTRLVIRE